MKFTYKGDDDVQEILTQIAAAKDDLDTAVSNFNQAIERDVIDYWVYRIKSAQTKYDFLTKELRRAENANKAG